MKKRPKRLLMWRELTSFERDHTRYDDADENEECGYVRAFGELWYLPPSTLDSFVVPEDSSWCQRFNPAKKEWDWCCEHTSRRLYDELTRED